MNWFRRMMYGRYGNDQFGNFLFVVYLLLFVLQRIFIRTVAAPVFALVSMLVIVLYFFRCFSRNIVNRQRENQKFLKFWNPVKNYFKFCRLRMKERSGTKKLYRCPKCHQTIRVPKGRGKSRFRVRNAGLNLLRKRNELETSHVSELLPFIGETGCLVM